MKKFLLKICLLLGIVLSLIKIFDSYYKTTNEYINLLTSREIVKFGNSYHANEIKDIIKFEPLQENLQIINLGNSHGRAGFNYSELLEYNSFNFGMSSQSPSYDYLLLDYYKDHIKEDSIVFIPISYFTLYYDELADKETFESLNIRYYDILGINYIQNVDIVYYIINKVSPLLFLENKEIYEVLFDQTEEIAVFNEKWYAGFNEFDSQAQIDIINSTVENHKSLIGNQVLNENTVLSYKNIIDLCEKEGYYPVLVTTPYLNEYNNEFDQDFYNQFHEDILKIATENEVLYLDYSHDLEFTNNHNYFSDADHLNEIGSNVFTNKILEKVLEEREDALNFIFS